MRHRLRGRQLSRDSEHRLSLRRNLVQSLIEHGRVRTTLPKAKEVQGFAEKLVTLAKRAAALKGSDAGKIANVNARRRVTALLRDRRLVDENKDFTGQTVVQKLFDEVAGKFADRVGGYTRIIKTADHRIGDGGDWVLLEFVTEVLKPTGTARKPAGLRRQRSERRVAFANKVLKAKPAPAEAAAA